MSEPIDLSRYRKAVQKCDEVANDDGPPNWMFGGLARCLACKHEWETKSPGGQHELTCPACACTRGVFVGVYQLPEGMLVYTCVHCSSTVYQITEVGAFCLGCGHHSVIADPYRP